MNYRHKEVLNFILEFLAENKREPYQYEICYGLQKTGKAVTLLLNNALPEYPKHLMVTPCVYELSLFYKDGMTIPELAKASGLTYENIYVKREHLEKLGIIFRHYNKDYSFLGTIDRPPKVVKIKQNKGNKKSKVNLNDEHMLYIKVKEGTHKGATGYIESFTSVANAILWINGEQVATRLETGEYDEIRGRI